MQISQLQSYQGKGCAVIDAVREGKIPQSRFDSYVEMYDQAKQLNEWEYKND